MRALLFLFFASLAQGAVKPNILIILADDLGFSDLGCYGSEISTPHLDALAVKGIRFSSFYNTARCWPTRATLMTGYYPQQVRREVIKGRKGSPKIQNSATPRPTSSTSSLPSLISPARNLNRIPPTCPESPCAPSSKPSQQLTTKRFGGAMRGITPFLKTDGRLSCLLINLGNSTTCTKTVARWRILPKSILKSSTS